MFAKILKANPYHDAAGRFASQGKATFVSTTGVFASRLDKLRGAGVSKTYTREEIDADITGLNKAGIRTMDGVGSHFLENYPGVKPSDVAGAMGAGGHVTSGRMRFNSRGQLSVGLDVEIAPGYPPKSYKISRDFDPVNRSVYHDFLSLSASAQGAGTVKQVFRESLPLYDKMGMKTVDVFANIDGGGYAWGRYGFNQKNTEFTDKASGGLESLSSKLAQRFKEANTPPSPELRKEFSALRELVNSKEARNQEFPRVFTSLKTPHLDATMGESGIKAMLKNQNWHGTLDLTDKEQRAHLNDYIKKR